MNAEERKRKFYNSMAWRNKRKWIKERDGNECQWCKEKGKLTTDNGERNRNGRKKNALIVHHIKEYEHYPELRLKDDNLVTVCFECHERHHERWRDNKKPRWDDERW